MATDGFTQKTRVWGASGVFESGNSIISVFWLWHLKISAKSEKWSKSVKNDTKDGIM